MTGFDILPPRTRDVQNRISSREFRPSTVEARALDNIIFAGKTDSASAALGNGDGVNISFTISQNSGYAIQANDYIAIYVGTISAANQVFPSVGSSQDITDWQITGPSYDWHDWNASSFSQSAEYMSMNVENVSAGSVTINIRARWRYVSPFESATSG